MAKELYTSTQLLSNSSDRPRTRPTSDHGKVRIQYFDVEVTTQGDADSEIDLFDLPSGAVRILPSMSRIENSAFGASRTLDIGHRLYRTASSYSVEPEAENFTAFAENINVAVAAKDVAISDDLKFDVYSKGAIRVSARVQGGTVPVGATLSGYFAYVYE